jgi:perosamine synthetase
MRNSPFEMIPYGRQCIEEDDIEAVVSALRSDWLTTGPMVKAFEEGLAENVGVRHAVVVSSGTAALHAAIYALGIRAGDEVVVPAMTFAATANSIVYQGGTPVFADVESDTLLIDPTDVEAKIGPRTKAVMAVDYAGQPCDYDALRRITEPKGIALISDACHALGARYKGKPVGSLSRLNTFSFHPVKHITTGEGGAVTTDDVQLAESVRLFRNHGISGDFRERELRGSWFYEMVDLGFNYRITDIQCALGLSQLKKLTAWVERRRAIAERYEEAFADIPHIEALRVKPEVYHSYHLYVIKIDFAAVGKSRTDAFRTLREKGIGVNVHYIPVHLHPYYRRRFNTHNGMCPNAEKAYEHIISLPIFPQMDDNQVREVVRCVREVCRTAPD